MRWLARGCAADRLRTGKAVVREPGSEAALRALLAGLGLPDRALSPLGPMLSDARKDFDPSARQKRQVQQLVEHTQKLLQSSQERRRVFWNKAKPTYRCRVGAVLHVLPQLPCRGSNRPLRSTAPAAQSPDKEGPRQGEMGRLRGDAGRLSRRLPVGHAAGAKGHQAGRAAAGGRLPARPGGAAGRRHQRGSAITGFRHVQGFAARLAERGFVVFAPHHYYRGGNRFRQLQRQAYPLKKTLFALVVAQHEQLLDWLKEQPFVDATRIGFYGLSYGGFSAQRLPAAGAGLRPVDQLGGVQRHGAEEGQRPSPYSYPFYNTYEVFEWNLANTFNYSDLAGLIAPRPFMVERGHQRRRRPGRVGGGGVCQGAALVRRSWASATARPSNGSTARIRSTASAPSRFCTST